MKLIYHSVSEIGIWGRCATFAAGQNLAHRTLRQRARHPPVLLRTCQDNMSMGKRDKARKRQLEGGRSDRERCISNWSKFFQCC